MAMIDYSTFIATFLLSICLLLILSCSVVEPQSIIKTLPGFPGDLPFVLETGYIGVGEMEDVQLFYYFVESEGSPKDDALVLWLTGGPGCSSFTGLVYEIGPLNFDYTKSSEDVPTFSLNPYSWTKVANIIFLDAPVGSGFSYARTSEGYNVGDKISAAQTYNFLRKWLLKHPQFRKNQLYIAGDSYSGIVVPIIVLEIANGNEAGLQPKMNLQGYVLGNPLTDEDSQVNFRVPYAHRVALISDELYESTKRSCNGEYVKVDPSNALCIKNLQIVTECIEKIHIPHILEPSCNILSPKPNQSIWDRRFFEENFGDFLFSPPQLPMARPWCRSYNYLFSYLWANDKTVQNALDIREGTVKDWVRCNESLSYTKDVPVSLGYHQNLTKKGYRALIYSGDHDMLISYLDTQAWIRSLNLTIDDDWKPWFVDGQVAGYTTKYTYEKYRMTFATVKGAGHTAPEYKPKECFAMVYRWFANYPL